MKYVGTVPILSAPVFYDRSKKRVWYILAVTILLCICLAVCMLELIPAQLAPIWHETVNQNPVFPRQVLNETKNGSLPVIGFGELLRIDVVKRLDGKIYLADPFSDAILRLATDDEDATIGKSNYVLEYFGQMPDHTIALTFDDGPSGDFTPQILDVLSKNHVPATFFNVGENVVSNPAVFQRMVREGHMVGNHTLTHIKFGGGDLLDREEIIGSSRLMAAQGYETRLFRLPYGEEEVNPLGMFMAQQLGYVDVSYDIDTDDWQYDDAGQAVPVPKLYGTDSHVVLMHDGGGNRAGTIKLLQSFIDEAKARGYKFTTLAPILPSGFLPQRIQPTATDQVSWDIAWTILALPNILITYLFWFAVGSLSITLCVYVVMAMVRDRRYRQRQWPGSIATKDQPFVSVIMPAHNEAKVIKATLNALRASIYNNLEVIVVSNASTDKTVAVLTEYAKGWRKLRVVDLPKQGKVLALNEAVSLAKGDIIVMLDADTRFERETVMRLVRHFDDPNLGAVAGHVKVGNRCNFLTAWQALEYLASACVTRMAEAAMGAIMIVPGACSAWRKSAILAAGGLSDNTLAEDCDLSLCLQRLGYRIEEDKEALAFTEAPMGLRMLAKQRLRWTFGNLQALFKHRDMLLRPRYGALGMVVLPYALLSIVVPLVFTPLMYMAAILSLVYGNWHSIALFGSFVMIVQFITSLAAVIIARERLSHLFLVPFYRFVYEPLRTYIIFASLFKAVGGRERATGWNSPVRTNTVLAWSNKNGGSY
jgi:cellulose synthase/poly-beta-1,6-N-acetylglucosamine synthase-like glycosyltransferase/peptidoglycan/xylan/chitin deacetylase (PgdA/CDA1 family)